MENKDSNNFFIADNLIETAKEFQYYLSQISPDDQPVKAAQAIEAMGDPTEINGSRKVIVHAIGAYVLYDALTTDSEIYHGMRLNDVTLRSEFSRLAFIRHDRLRALCLYMFESKVLHSQETVYDNETIRSGVFVPVHEVESVWAA